MDIAWAAGLFEGEGSISVQRGGRKVQLALGMRDRDVVERFLEVVGVGAVRFDPRQRPEWSDIWRWQTSGWTNVPQVAVLLLPFLGKRRTERITEVLAMKPDDWTPRGHRPRPSLLRGIV